MGCNDCDGTENRDRPVLERIVVLLLSLAGLADIAAASSSLRRRKVLEILIRGEDVARTFIMEMALGISLADTAELAVAPERADVPANPVDAARLAARFRALALALCVMLAQVWRFHRSAATGSRTARRGFTWRVGFGNPLAPRAPDTS